MQDSLAFNIVESSQVGEARRSTAALAAALGFSTTKQGEIAIIVTEIGTNLFRHAAHGELFVRVLETANGTGLEFTGVDSGPGMASLTLCLQDGYSTAGTGGNGLGAISRLSNLLDIYTTPGEGTILVAQVWATPPPAPLSPNSLPNNLEIGVINRPKPGQEICGDSWAVEQRPDRSLLFMADGLGHGPDAAAASQDAVRAFRKHRTRRPSEIIEAVHLALRGTRGAAAAVAELDFVKREVCFAGIGNIAGSIVSVDQSVGQSTQLTQNMVSHNGIVGHQMRKVQEFVYRWDSRSLFVMHSDGLSSRWQLNRYPGLTVRHPRLIAGVLYRDYQRQNDDTTVLIASEP